MTPIALTLNLLRQSRFIPTVVERWNAHAGVRQDLFGFADVLAIDTREGGFLLIQCTSLGHVADRLAKAVTKPELAAWLKAGGRFEVWGWAWYKRANRWDVKRVAVQPGDLEAIVVSLPRRRRRADRQPELFKSET